MDKLKILYVLLGLILSSCSTNNIQAPVLNQNNSISTHAVSYIVKPNDTLYSIAWQSGKDYKELAKWNGISTPFTIYSCLLYTSPSPRDAPLSRMPSSA